jgi:GTP-binding protein
MLTSFRYVRNFKAGAGGNGRGRLKTGKTGKNCIVEVPVGTIIKEKDENGREEVIADLAENGASFIIATGGEGGKGNRKFTRPQNRTPLLAEDGEDTRERKLSLELQLLADVGIIGKPSVGKSSMLRSCSRAKPDVAAYPFTTLEPVLGVVDAGKTTFVIAEIPGLIEGAHKGLGLGHEFLRHAKRTKGTVHILDGTSNNLIQDYKQIKNEMLLYDKQLLNKWEIIAINKFDVDAVRARKQEIKAELAFIFEHNQNSEIHFVSALSGEGIYELMQCLSKALIEKKPQNENYSPSVYNETKQVAIIYPKPKTETIKVIKEGNLFLVNSSKAERIVRKAKIEDKIILAQVMNELKRLGIIKALEKAGIAGGSIVRIGSWEMEWE